MKRKRQRRAGRPRGSKTAKRGFGFSVGSICDNCGSQRRAPYKRKPRILYGSGVIRFGRQNVPYTRILERATHCLECKQARWDREYKFVAADSQRLK